MPLKSSKPGNKRPIQMSGLSYTTPRNTGHRNHPVQKIIPTSAERSSGLTRQQAQQTPVSAWQQITETPSSSNSQEHYSTPGSSAENNFQNVKQDHYLKSPTDPYNTKPVSPNLQSTKESLKALAEPIAKLRELHVICEKRLQQAQEQLEELRNEVEKDISPSQDKSTEIKKDEIQKLSDDINKQHIVIKVIEYQLGEHVKNQKRLEILDQNFQIKKRNFEEEIEKQRRDYQNQQGFQYESLQQQQSEKIEKMNIVSEIAKTIPEVSEIERIVEKAFIAEQTAAAAETPVSDTKNQRKAMGTTKVRFG